MRDARSTRRKSFEGLQAVKRDTSEATDEVNVKREGASLKRFGTLTFYVSRIKNPRFTFAAMI